MEREFFASCLPGLEGVLADELKTFDVKRVRPLSGGVAFFCTFERAYRACLWSRLASRIMLVVGRVDATDAEALYAGACNLAWEDVLAEGATFAVRAQGANDQLRNTRFTALKVKDAIVDRLRAQRGARPAVDAASPRASVDVRIRDRRATVSLDFSGEALNHRDYLRPDDGHDAALACTLAAGMLALAGWDDRARAGEGFVDPACRDGIVLVEAASVACDRAPGLQREKWGFFGWARHDHAIWRSLAEEAADRFQAGLARMAGPAALAASPSAPPDAGRVRMVGASSSSPLISRARDHVRRAGLRQAVSVELGDSSSAGDLASRVARCAAQAGSPAVMVASNLDAQARSDSPAYAQADEAAFAAAACAAPDGSRFAVCDALDAPARFDAVPVRELTVGAGRIAVPVAVYDERPAGIAQIEIADPAGGALRRVEVFEQASEQFAARMRKVFKERRKWAARAGVSCYRIYDADLPGYAVAIDWYAGAGEARGNSYLHIAEYAPPASIDPDKARRRFNDVLAIAPIVCGVRPDHVFSKRRMRAKGGSQYRNAGAHRPYVTTVEEGGYRFEVDLASRLDTGLFLDHRPTRELVGARAAGADFLNLFAYTGAASVYAAGGGAATTTTVDLSQTYLDWARRNMAANGFTGRAHAFERADVMQWVTEARRARKHYDLIFVDPPTFSNSKAMGKRTWDVQRDHVELLIGVAHLLAEGGEAVFSCNLRSFKPQLDDLARYGVALEDISADTIPQDYARTPKIHKCYLVRRVRAD